MPGVIAYSWNQGDVYVLLGKEAGGKEKGKWDHFSGGRESYDKSNFDAAAREGVEESCHLFGDKSAIQSRMFKLNSGDTSYMLKVHFERGVNDRFQKLKKLKKFKAWKFQEKSKVKWVKLATLIDGAANRNGVFQHGKDKVVLRDYFTTMVNHNQQNFSRLFPHLTQQKNGVKKKAPAKPAAKKTSHSKEKHRVKKKTHSKRGVKGTNHSKKSHGIKKKTH